MDKTQNASNKTCNIFALNYHKRPYLGILFHCTASSPDCARYKTDLHVEVWANHTISHADVFLRHTSQDSSTKVPTNSKARQLRTRLCWCNNFHPVNERFWCRKLLNLTFSCFTCPPKDISLSVLWNTVRTNEDAMKMIDYITPKYDVV